MTTDMHISEKSTVVEDVFDGHLRAESPIIGIGQLSHPSDRKSGLNGDKRW